uniref:C-C motif chemokine n=1 Tax=Varanus komodoensis TaxID=61221 RepID=A0A8D2J2I9_VARKO
MHKQCSGYIPRGFSSSYSPPFTLGSLFSPLAMCPSCPKECCFAVRKGRPLPRRIMASFYKITNDCYLNAIVLVTKTGKQICVDPEATWVRTAMKELPERK